MNHLDHWNGKRVLITGGTSGLGEALARQLSESGARVAIVARGRAGLDRVKAELPDVVVIQADVSKEDDVRRIVVEAHAGLGGVDVLVNNASALGPTPLRLLVDTESADLEEVLQTNLLGPFRLTKAILPDMLLRGKGLVIHISSDAAIQPYPTWGPYGASKAALHHMSQIFQEELGERGLRFLSIDPGDMDTPMHHAAIPDADPKELLDPADAARRVLEQAASAQAPSAEEVAS